MRKIPFILFIFVALQLWFVSAENVYYEYKIFHNTNENVQEAIDTFIAAKLKINLGNENGQKLWRDMIDVMDGRPENCNWLVFGKNRNGKSTIVYQAASFHTFRWERFTDFWQNWFIGACRLDQHNRLIDVFVFVDPQIKDEYWWKQYIISQNDSDVYKYIPIFNVLGEDVFMAIDESMFYLVAHDSTSLYTVDTIVSILARPELYNQTKQQ